MNAKGFFRVSYTEGFFRVEIKVFFRVGCRHHPVTTLKWPPVRFAAAQFFLTRAVAEDDRHLVSSDGFFARRSEVDTSLSSTWGDWIMIAFSSEKYISPSSQRLVSQGTLLCVNLQHLCLVELGQTGAGGLWSTPAPYGDP